MCTSILKHFTHSSTSTVMTIRKAQNNTVNTYINTKASTLGHLLYDYTQIPTHSHLTHARTHAHTHTHTHTHARTHTSTLWHILHTQHTHTHHTHIYARTHPPTHARTHAHTHTHTHTHTHIWSPFLRPSLLLNTVIVLLLRLSYLSFR